MRIFLLLFIYVLPISLYSQERSSIDVESLKSWEPKTYLCEQPIDTIRIDGKGDELSWRTIPWSSDFVDILGGPDASPPLVTNMKLMWDSANLYILAKMEEPHIWAAFTDRDEVIYQDDAFEIFIDPDGDGHNYFELQVNANNALWDLFVLWPFRQKVYPNTLSGWDAAGIQHAVHVQGTLNDPYDEDEYWMLEMAIPWTALSEMATRAKAPKPNDIWRMNFARVDWPMDIVKGGCAKSVDPKGQNLPESYSTWTPQGEVNMHKPERWGYVKFSNSKVGMGAKTIWPQYNEEVKWALWQLYYQQIAFYERYGFYQSDVTKFKLPKNLPCTFEPSLSIGVDGFQFSNRSCNGRLLWVINEMGRCYSLKK